MALRGKYLTGCAGLALAAMISTPAFAVDPSRLLSADQNANDWLTTHGSYKSYHYSPADQINAGNVKNLEVAWTHFPERATRGIQSTPLAADGVLYYSGSYSRVYALDGATGKVLWTYVPDSTRNSSPSRPIRPTIAGSRSPTAMSMWALSTDASSHST